MLNHDTKSHGNNISQTAARQVSHTAALLTAASIRETYRRFIQLRAAVEARQDNVANVSDSVTASQKDTRETVADAADSLIDPKEDRQCTVMATTDSLSGPTGEQETVINSSEDLVGPSNEQRSVADSSDQLVGPTNAQDTVVESTKDLAKEDRIGEISAIQNEWLALSSDLKSNKISESDYQTKLKNLEDRLSNLRSDPANAKVAGAVVTGMIADSRQRIEARIEQSEQGSDMTSQRSQLAEQADVVNATEFLIDRDVQLLDKSEEAHEELPKKAKLVESSSVENLEDNVADSVVQAEDERPTEEVVIKTSVKEEVLDDSDIYVDASVSEQIEPESKKPLNPPSTYDRDGAPAPMYAAQSVDGEETLTVPESDGTMYYDPPLDSSDGRANSNGSQADSQEVQDKQKEASIPSGKVYESERFTIAREGNRTTITDNTTGNVVFKFRRFKNGSIMVDEDRVTSNRELMQNFAQVASLMKNDRRHMVLDDPTGRNQAEVMGDLAPKGSHAIAVASYVTTDKNPVARSGDLEFKKTAANSYEVYTRNEDVPAQDRLVASGKENRITGGKQDVRQYAFLKGKFLAMRTKEKEFAASQAAVKSRQAQNKPIQKAARVSSEGSRGGR